MPATENVPTEKKDKKSRKKKRKPLPPLTHSLRDAGMAIPALPRVAVQKPEARRDNNSDRGNSVSPDQESETMGDPTTPTTNPETPTPGNGGAVAAPQPAVQPVAHTPAPAPAPAPAAPTEPSFEMMMAQHVGTLLGQFGEALNKPEPEPEPEKFDGIGVLNLGAKVATCTLIGGGALIGVVAAIKAITGGGSTE